MSRVVFLALTFLSFSLGGCGSCDTSGGEPVLFTEGFVNDSRTAYQTNRFDEEYLHFPSGRTFDLIHGLATTPYLIQSYVAFDPNPLARSDEDNTNNTAESAGNQVVIEASTPERIRVRNDTCAELYLRVVALADPDWSG